MKLGVQLNEYGTPVALYRCEYCGEIFTVCPIPEDDSEWVGCQAPICASYDKCRDADRLFEEESGSDSRIFKIKRVEH